MCGILALFSSREEVLPSSLKSGLDCLNHRGPDGQRYWISNNGQVGLGHTRLSIIDLDRGQQPISNQDDNLHIITNGEFYDFENIRQDLKKRGYQFKTHSDAEIALHLYDEFGTTCLHHLRGEFAFIIWDERNQLIFAGRDRFGIKPLYYSYYRNTLYLASEIKAILAAGVPAAWDEASFWQAESDVLSPDKTFFAQIRQVPPGCFLLASHSGIQLHRYWDFNYPTMADSPTQYTEADYIQQLRYTLEEAVKLRLRADVPVGCYLSGGLDSSTVLGIAAKYSPKPIDTFTLTFEQADYDEAAIACETAEYTGANQHLIPIRQSDLAEYFADSIWHCEMLSFNGGTTAKYLLSRAARDAGYKVILTGEGSDEIFGGYVHFRQDMLLYNQPVQDAQATKALLQDLRSKNQVSIGTLFAEGNVIPSLNTIKRLLGFVPSWMQASAEGHVRTLPYYSPELLAKFAHRDVYRLFFNQIDVQGQLTNREPVHQSLYIWSKTRLPNYLLRMLGDNVEMAHSIEGRVPFLDHKVVELVRNISGSLKINGLTEKYILREVAKPFITETMYKRQKHPFLAPPATSRLNEPFQQLIQDTLRSETMSHVPFYNHKAVINLLDELPEMNDNQRKVLDPILTKMLSACILQEKFQLV